MAIKASTSFTITDISDAYSVTLTSESYTFVGNTNGAPPGLSCSTQVVAYCGAKPCSKVTIASVTCPAGISAVVSDNNTMSPTITFTTTATVTTACEATIPVTVDGVTVNKKFSFAVAKTGSTGAAGTNYWQNSVWLDLSSDTYKQDTWYPVIGAALPSTGAVRIAVSVQLNSGTKPTWSTHNSGFSVDLDIQTQRSGWGTTVGKTLIFLDNYNFCSVSPASFQQLTHGSIPVLFLRGGGKYLVSSTYVPNWKIYTTTYTWGSGSSSQSASPVKSRPMPDGSNIDKKGVSSTEIRYQAGTSGTSAPTGDWLASPPTVNAGSYLWTRTVYKYTDNTTVTAYSVGKMGTNGAAGRGIKSTTITYQAAASGTTVPTGTWSSSVPKTSSAFPYVWSRTVLTYTDNTTSTTYSVGSTPDSILVGGRNFVTNSDFSKGIVQRKSGQNGWKIPTDDTSIATDVKYNGHNVLHRYRDNITTTTWNELQYWWYDIGDMVEDLTITVSCMCYMNTDTEVPGICIRTAKNGSRVADYGGASAVKTKLKQWQKIVKTVTIPGGSDIDAIYFFDSQALNYDYYLADFKLEKGNRATDWTPAPEDFYDTISDTAAGLTKTIFDQKTDIIKHNEEILLQAKETLVGKDDFATYKEYVESQLSVTSDKIEASFKDVSGSVNDVAEKLPENFEEIIKHIRLSGAGIEISGGTNESEDNRITLTLDNDNGIVFSKNGEAFGRWDGNNFYTGNIVIELHERAQFGNFAFIPRSDGSLSFLKVGDN